MHRHGRIAAGEGVVGTDSTDHDLCKAEAFANLQAGNQVWQVYYVVYIGFNQPILVQDGYGDADVLAGFLALLRGHHDFFQLGAPSDTRHGNTSANGNQYESKYGTPYRVIRAPDIVLTKIHGSPSSTCVLASTITHSAISGLEAMTVR